MATEEEELGGRKVAVLHAVIEEYIRTGEPVGSETVAELTQYAGLAIPPLSTEDRIVRAELIDLGSSILLLVVGQHGRVFKALLPRGEHAHPRTMEGASRRLDGIGDLTLAAAADYVR